MRIVFFSHYFPPEGNAPASRTYDHCLQWVKAGHEVTVITCAPNVPSGVVYEGYRNRLWPQKEVVDGIRVVRVWTWLAPNAGTARRIANFLSYMFSSILAFLFVRRPNVIVATSPQFFCGWAGVICSWIKWVPFVLEIRDIWPESITTVGAMKRGLMIRVLERLERWMYRAANHIVAVGDGYRDKILEKLGKPERVSVVTNGIHVADFEEADEDPELLGRAGFEGKFVCAYVGTIGMAHGLEVVLKAAKFLKESPTAHNIGFLIVGDGAQREELMRQSQDWGLEDSVVFTGRLPKESMPSVLKSCNALLVHLRGTELFETVIPSKIFEAMAAGRPIIMGVKGEAARIVERAGSGLMMEPDDSEGLVDAVRKMASDPVMVDQMQQAGPPFVAAHYSREQLAQKMLDILQAVASRKPVEA